MSEVSIDLGVGEAFVVADVEFWDGLVDLCRSLAKDFDREEPEYTQWIEIAEFIEEQALTNMSPENWEIAEYEDEEEEPYERRPLRD